MSGNVSVSDDGGLGGLVTARFKHIVTAEGHAIITGRDGEVLQKCEDEPIHIPGAIQGFGLLIALSEHEDNQLLVRLVSENSQRMIGYTPQELFRLDSFLDILSEDQQVSNCENPDFRAQLVDRTRKISLIILILFAMKRRILPQMAQKFLQSLFATQELVDLKSFG